MNDELVAQLEAERLTGMPRWQPLPAALDELRRRAAVLAHQIIWEGVDGVKSDAISAALPGASTPDQGLTTTTTSGSHDEG